mmetsp:Transcript_5424/g.19072  ORF Transcript_5424/g.19072 Transcript_5424/m.19072 type:complete len:360 (+) Transcript_5424:273-1352(+)
MQVRSEHVCARPGGGRRRRGRRGRKGRRRRREERSDGTSPASSELHGGPTIDVSTSSSVNLLSPPHLPPPPPRLLLLLLSLIIFIPVPMLSDRRTNFHVWGVGHGGDDRRAAELVLVPGLDVEDAVRVRVFPPSPRATAMLGHVGDGSDRVDEHLPAVLEDLHLPQPGRIHVQCEGRPVGPVLDAVDGDVVVGVRVGQAVFAKLHLVDHPQLRAPPDRPRRVLHLRLDELLVQFRHVVLDLVHLALHQHHPAAAVLVPMDRALRVGRPAHEQDVHVLIGKHQIPRVLGGVGRVPVHVPLVLLLPREPLRHLPLHNLAVVRVVVAPLDVGLEEREEGGESVRIRHQRPRHRERGDPPLDA